MIMKTKNVLLGMAAVCGCAFQAIACTGIALTAADGSYVQSRTIEWARGVLQSEYVVIPRGQRLRSFTPSGADGMVFTSKYGVVGLAVVQKEFIAEGINEAGCRPDFSSFRSTEAMNSTIRRRATARWPICNSWPGY